jgi:hypothetical protein
MTTPRVIETPQRQEPVEPDPFIEGLSRSSPGRSRLIEREERERRVDLVRRIMRVRGIDGPATRNGWPARRTGRT